MAETTQDPELLRKLLDKVPGSVHAFRVDASGAMQMLYASEGSAQLYELPMAQILGEGGRASSRFHPDDLASIRARIAESTQNLTQLRWVGRLTFDDDRTKWVRMVSVPERQPDGSTVWYGTMLDVTEEIEAQQQAQALREEQGQQSMLFKAVIDNLPLAVSVITERGDLLLINRASEEMFGNNEKLDEGAMLPAGYGVFFPDRETPMPLERMTHVRGLREVVEDDDSFVRMPQRPEGIMVQSSARPLVLKDGLRATVILSRDVTQQRTLEDELRRRNHQLASSEEEKSQLVARLRLAVDELSNPILEVWDDVLAMPIIGVVDSRRTADMAQRLLAEVARTQAQSVIIDLTGVEVVDTKTADNLIKLVRKVELIGARCVLTGIRPSVAETVVEIGVEFAGLTTLRNLKHGLQEALGLGRRRRRLKAAEEPAEETGAPARKRGHAND